MSKKKTTEQFIKEAREVHKDEFDYSESIYKGKDEPLIIICKKHGKFLQRPSNHIRLKHGCPKCKYEKLSLEQRSNKAEFVEKARKVHGDEYEYIGEYINEKIPIEIMCPIHGVFKQSPHSHLSGHGCPKCANNNKLTNEGFVIKAIAKHRNKYIYTNVEYKNSISKIKIICPIHGEFEQIPYYHLQGAGCPKCNESKLEREIRVLLEDNDIEYIYQCRKNDLKWLGKQSLDFYLPKYKIAIECQGIQHYKDKNNIFESLDKNFERDKVKYEKCINNGINVFYYSYKIFEKYHIFGNFYWDKNKLLKEIKKYGT